jgi:tetratricopeptide (TPR) repeat protein
MEIKEQSNIHFGVAEKGKILAIQGNHKEALRHYKEALRMCQIVPNADIFFQHYSLCAMESLELMKSYNEVIEFCDKCLEFLDTKPDFENHTVFQKFKASLWERKGIQFLHLGEKEDALDAFKEAQKIIDRKHLPLTYDLLNWILRGFTISTKQIQDAQNKHQYFTVRKDNINEKIAVELPEMINPF